MNTTTTWHDPVVAELHATRAQLANQYHNDFLANSNAAEAPEYDRNDWRKQ